MNRWTLSNEFRSMFVDITRNVSYKEFLSISQQFKDAVERASGEETRFDISLMSENRVYTSYVGMDDYLLEGIAKTNEDNTFFTTDNLSEVTKELWEKAQYVDLHLCGTTKETNYNKGYIEFKGNAPHQSYFGAFEDGVMEELVAQNPKKKLRTNWEAKSNADRSVLMPSEVVGMMKKANSSSSFLPSFGFTFNWW